MAARRVYSYTSTRNKRSVWMVSLDSYVGAHFATFPPTLIEPMILAGCPLGGTVLDPFAGAGTTGLVAQCHGRAAVLIDLNPEYAVMARDRIKREYSKGNFLRDRDLDTVPRIVQGSML